MSSSSILEPSMMSLPAEPPTPPTRTSEALRSELKEVNEQLDAMKRSWEQERKKILGENAVLQDAATKLNADMRNAQDELRKYASAERASERTRASLQNVSRICDPENYTHISIGARPGQADDARSRSRTQGRTQSSSCAHHGADEGST